MFAIVAFMSNDHKEIQASKKLQAKAGIGDIDKKSIEKAQHFADNNKVVYSDVVQPLLGLLRRSLDRLESEPSQKNEILKDIKSSIMDMKASAATFSYPLISRLCSPLLLHLENRNDIDKETFKLVDLLYHIVSIVVRNDESDLKKSLSRELEDTFLAACEKLAKKANK